MSHTDLPVGYRWATADETEAWGKTSAYRDAIWVKRTADSNGVPYTHDEADLALPEAIIVLPKATVTKVNYAGNLRSYRVTSVELDANENSAGEALHVIHGTDRWGQTRWWFETSESLRDLFDVALGNG